MAIKNRNQVSVTGSIKLADNFSAIGAILQKITAVDTKKSPSRKLVDAKASSKKLSVRYLPIVVYLMYSIQCIIKLTIIRIMHITLWRYPK